MVPNSGLFFEKEIQKERSELSKEQLQELVRSNPDEIRDSLDYLRTKSALLLIVLDYLYAGRHDESKRVLEKQWPPNFQEKTWNEMVSGYCTGLRAHLELESRVPCGE